MKQISKKLILKKKTVAVLNDQELNQVVGGKVTGNCLPSRDIACPAASFVCTY